MALGMRQPTWKEQENNNKKERQNKGMMANISSDLRMHDNYQLLRHCGNNEVLKALYNEVGWTVEPNNTTYYKGASTSSSFIPISSNPFGFKEDVMVSSDFTSLSYGHYIVKPLIV
ncbi:BES1/BZR1-like protein 4, partial [Mucuna pruriens]